MYWRTNVSESVSGVENKNMNGTFAILNVMPCIHSTFKAMFIYLKKSIWF